MIDNYEILDLVAAGQIESAKELLKKGCDVNQPKDDHGNSAIMVAATRNDLKMVKVLIKGGAKVNVENDFGYTPLYWAKKNNNSEMIKIIEKAIKTEKEAEEKINRNSRIRLT